MKKILEKAYSLLNHLDVVDSVLRTDSEYLAASNELDSVLTEEVLENIYLSIDKETDRQMSLADIIEYILFGRGYWDIVIRRTNKTKKKSFKDYYRILLRITNLLFLQDSILTQKENFNLRKKLLQTLKQNLKDDSDSYKIFNDFDSFLYAPWGESRKEIDEKQREKAYDKLDQLLPKVRGLPNEIIACIHLLRKNCGYVLPLFLNQRILSYNAAFYVGEIDFIVPPDLLVLGENKNIIGIEVGRTRGADRHINKFSRKTGIPVIFADTENISNHRCPYCMKWTLFCDFVIKYGMDAEYRDNDKMLCKQCNLVDRDYGRNCPYSLVHVNEPAYYKGGAHYHYKCIEKYYLDQGRLVEQIIQEISDDDIFTYFPHVGGLDQLTSLYFQLP